MRLSEDATRTRSSRQPLPLLERLMLAVALLRAWEQLSAACYSVVRRKITWKCFERTSAPLYKAFFEAVRPFVAQWAPEAGAWVWPPVGEFEGVCSDLAGLLKSKPRDLTHPWPIVLRWRMIRRAVPANWNDEAWLVATFGGGTGKRATVDVDSQRRAPMPGSPVP